MPAARYNNEAKTVTEIEKVIGGRIRQARQMKGMSQEKLGEALGITFQQIQKYEKGTNRVSVGRLIEISTILGCSVNWFLQEDDDAEVISPDAHPRLTAKLARLSDPKLLISVERVVDVLLEIAPTPVEA